MQGPLCICHCFLGRFIAFLVLLRAAGLSRNSLRCGLGLQVPCADQHYCCQ